MIVYKATNMQNGKAYIGITSHSLEIRKSIHKSQALSGFSNSPFHQAIREYGFNSFNWEIIDNTNIGEELAEKERYWIEYYKTDDPAYGYNVQKGGQYVKHSECSIRKPFPLMMDEEVIKQLKLQAVKENTDASKIIEKLVKEYLQKMSVLREGN